MRTVVRIMWVPVIIAALYTGWVFWQRHSQPDVSKTVQKPDNPLAKFGSGVKILQFYTEAAEIPAGGQALLCYGVVNAATVRLEPPVAPVWPSMSRCFAVTPAKTTRYTLTAEGADHQSAAESIEIVVRGGHGGA